MTLVLGGVAWADNLQNDVVAGGNDIILAGGSTTIGYRLIGNAAPSGDINACNVDVSNPATVTISTASQVTNNVSGSFQLTACGNGGEREVVFSSLVPGDYPITVSISGGKTGALYNNQANFTLHVLAPPDSMPPEITPNITGTLGNNGWYRSDVTVSWSVIDNESAISSSSGCGSTLIDSDTAGTTLTCTATSAGGTSTASVTIKRDATAPTISAALDKSPALSGWFNATTGAPTVGYTCSDALSGVAGSCPASHTFAEGADQTHTATVFDNAGNSASAGVSNIDIDTVAPTITAVLDRAPAITGWFNLTTGAPVLDYTCSDATSGLADSCPDFTFGEGGDQSDMTTVSDNAGNSATAGVTDVDVDLTPPAVSVTGVFDGATYILGSVPAAGCDTTDSLSGVASVATLSSLGGPLGSITATCSGALDIAGNTGSASATYSVIFDWIGFLRPIDNLPTLNKVKAGSAIPVKFSLSGNQGLGIFETGFPTSKLCYCEGSEPYDSVEETVTAGHSSLSYDPVTDQYVYVWKTDKSWAGTCRQLNVKLIDGTTQIARFLFTK